MALLFYSRDDNAEAWRQGLLTHMPDLDYRVWPDFGNKSEIDMALVWLPPPGMLAELPNLRAIFSLAAGVDAMLADHTLPDLPLCKMIDPSLAQGMSEFILYHTLRYYRRFDIYERQQRRAEWRLDLPDEPARFTVGVMGLGELGTHAAELLLGFGFSVRGWSRSSKSVAGVQVFAGGAEFQAFVGPCDVVVCLLPLTDQTKGMLNAGFFAQMKPGSRLLHVGRGQQLDEAALLAAVQSGHLSGAVVDVTPVEPLDRDSALWRHPRITLTPHAASYVQPVSGGAFVVENIRRLRAGEPLLGVVDRGRGY